MSDVVDRFRGLAQSFAQRVEGTPDDGWDADSPCDGWKARDVVFHVVNNHRRMAAALADTEAEPLPNDADPKVAWRESYSDLMDKLSDPSSLTKTIPGPMGPMPTEMLIGRLAANDVLVHTWDLARATGQDEQLDQDAVAHAFEGLKRVEAMIRQPGVFGPAVEPPAGADLQTQFLCFLGRKV